MTYILEAFSPSDGVAIIRRDRSIQLIRPPYKQTSAIETLEYAIQDAVLKHGFHVSGEPFKNREKIIVFLNHQVAEYRENQGQPLSETFTDIEILDCAPLEILQNFLKKVEDELIPQQQFEHARNFLLALLKSSASENQDLTDQANFLLEQVLRAEENKDNSIGTLENQEANRRIAPDQYEEPGLK